MDCLCDEIPRVGFRIGSPRQVLYDTEVRSVAMDVAEVGVLKLPQNESICFYRVHFTILSTGFPQCVERDGSLAREEHRAR